MTKECDVALKFISRNKFIVIYQNLLEFYKIEHIKHG